MSIVQLSNNQNNQWRQNTAVQAYTMVGEISNALYLQLAKSLGSSWPN